MIGVPAPFPYAGSHALLIDEDLPLAAQRLELVRIQWRGVNAVAVSFPLRDGASGNKSVPFADLIDASPLTRDELREFHDLDRALTGRLVRTAKQKAAKARRDALKQRLTHGPILDRLLRFAGARAIRQRKAA